MLCKVFDMSLETVYPDGAIIGLAIPFVPEKSKVLVLVF